MPRNSIRERFSNYFSRSAVRARNNLGIVMGDEREGVRKTRNKELDIYDSYYEGTQYDKLPRWEDSHDKSGDFIPVRKRQPRIMYNFSKVLVDRMTAKLVGDNTFPALKIEDDPDANTLLGLVVKSAKLPYSAIEMVRRMCLSGSSLIRYQMVDGSLILETYQSKYCYPVFKPNRQLQMVKIMYVYEDDEDRDATGNPKKKWYRLDLTEAADILYDNPEYNNEQQPTFNVVSTEQHNLGFVQAEWCRTAFNKHSPDGPSLIGEVLDFIDELNYNLSQSSQAVAYNQEPQLTINTLDEDGVERLIKSSSKAWNLGKEGKAEYLETNMEGVKTAGELRDKVRLAVQDVARVVMLDPEKVVGHAQSGKAMEVLHGPMIELINELRPMVELALTNIAIKMTVTLLKYASQGFDTEVQIPPGYAPQSLTVTAHWPQIFPQTMDDLNLKAQVAISVTAGNLISRETMTRWIAQDFGVEDVEEELARIEEQPPLDPFGAMGNPDQMQPDKPGGNGGKAK